MNSSRAPRCAIPTLTVLLRIRQDMLERRKGPYLYIGMADASWMATFVGGYRQCLSALGAPDEDYALFREWLELLENPKPGLAWDGRYLEEFNGDHERAVRKFLERVAEFVARVPETPAPVPTRFPPPTLELLRELHRVGRLGMFIGPVEVRRMAGLIAGHRLCLALADAQDEEYTRFEQWLQLEKDLPPGQSWEQPLLQSCHGDHAQAIGKLLEYAAEFRAR